MGLAVVFGRNVRERRVSKGITLEALAHDVGLSYSYLGELERGRRNPTLKVIEQIARALEVDALVLLQAEVSQSR
ncbi:helix-turn-helix transcriptional regulator [Brevundimonas sp. C43]|uniref:helix-turn-helix domain-containing protein n=1 Tax=Brevundimonas sp. C43 TaxID=3068314 RepID=UPI0025E3BB71|nr:helix-turn-helix transcriptional regulator [Brevundimonas sp. C43]MBU2419118.1 helix-turn-helix domain-containing protein [Alphaproteobacteria bacterium]